jgi:hypothetical protein
MGRQLDAVRGVNQGAAPLTETRQKGKGQRHAVRRSAAALNQDEMEG